MKPTRLSLPPFLFAILVLLIGGFGCGGPRQPTGRKVMRLPPAPPRVPPARPEPLNPELRASARGEINTAFSSSDPILRANALEAAQNGMGDEAHGLIMQGLKDPEPIVRFAACMAAGQLRFRGAHEALLAMANDQSPRVRIGVRFALHRLGDTRLSHDLEKLARDPQPEVRADTVMVLGLLGEKSALKILRHMINDPDPNIRIQVAEAMWRLGDEAGLEVLVAGTVSHFVDDQLLCIAALAAPKDQRVEEHLRGKLVDDYPEIELVAARALGELGIDAGYGVAMNAVRASDARQRHLAALALGSIGRSDAQATLGAMLKDPEPRVRLAAAAALLELKDPAAAAARP